MDFKKTMIAGILTVFVSGMGTVLFAQEDFSGQTSSQVKVLAVEDAVSLALENNLEIKQGAMDLEILALKDRYSWNGVAPSFSLGTSISGGSSQSFSDTLKNWSVSGGVSLSLTPALATSIKSARLAYETGEITLETTKRKIELAVRKTFYSLLYFNENLELNQRNLDAAKKTYESNLTKYNQGRLDELTLLNSQYNYEKKIPAVENLKSTYKKNLNDFKIVLGLDLSEEINLTGSLDEALNFSLNESILQVDVDELPSIKSARKNIEKMENALSASKYSAYSPSISFSVNDSIKTASSKMPGEKSEGGISNQFSYSASVRVPLDGYLPWTNTKISIKEQNSNIEKQKQNLEQSKIKERLSVENTYNEILQAQEQLSLLEKNVQISQKTYDLTKKAYDLGAKDLTSLQTVETNLATAKYDVTNQKYQIISKILELENTLGLPFGTLNQQK